jgi:hypothetical protein
VDFYGIRAGIDPVVMKRFLPVILFAALVMSNASASTALQCSNKSNNSDGNCITIADDRGICVSNCHLAEQNCLQGCQVGPNAVIVYKIAAQL